MSVEDTAPGAPHRFLARDEWRRPVPKDSPPDIEPIRRDGRSSPLEPERRDHESVTHFYRSVRAQRSRRHLPLLILALIVVGGVVVATAGSSPSRAPLEFGIYPGGPVGTIGTSDSPLPENPTLRLAELESLRGTSRGRPRPFIIRLYETFTGEPQVDSWTGSGANALADREITAYAAAGFELDVVVRYEPVQANGPATLPMYLQFLRGIVDRYASDHQVRYLQVANEVNVTTSPQSSDGYYSGAVPALVFGVEAAASEAARHPLDSLEVGFNWAEETGATANEPLWQLISQQGAAFRKSVRWVGLDDYPGTFTAVSTSPDQTGTRLAADAGLLRRLMRQSGLPQSVPMHISETGYPTGPGRSWTNQVTAMRAMIKSVTSVDRRDHITSLEWFDLRDSNSSASNFQEHYGVLTDRYQPKLAFKVLQQAIVAGAS